MIGSQVRRKCKRKSTEVHTWTANKSTLKYARAVEYPKMAEEVRPRWYGTSIFHLAFALHDLHPRFTSVKCKRKKMKNFPFLASAVAFAFAFASYL